MNDQVTVCSTSIAYSSFDAILWQMKENRQGRLFLLDTLWPSDAAGTCLLGTAPFWLRPNISAYLECAHCNGVMQCLDPVCLRDAGHDTLACCAAIQAFLYSSVKHDSALVWDTVPILDILSAPR